MESASSSPLISSVAFKLAISKMTVLAGPPWLKNPLPSSSYQGYPVALLQSGNRSDHRSAVRIGHLHFRTVRGVHAPRLRIYREIVKILSPAGRSRPQRSFLQQMIMSRRRTRQRENSEQQAGQATRKTDQTRNLHGNPPLRAGLLNWLCQGNCAMPPA